MILLSMLKKRKINPMKNVLFIKDNNLLLLDNTYTTNKKALYITNSIEEHLVKAIELPTLYTKAKNENVQFLDKYMIVTQDNIPVKVKNNFEIISCDLNFKRNGYKANQVYLFVFVGFPEDIKKYLTVYFVTDNYIFFKDNKNIIYTYSYEELKYQRHLLTGNKRN